MYSCKLLSTKFLTGHLINILEEFIAPNKSINKSVVIGQAATNNATPLIRISTESNDEQKVNDLSYQNYITYIPCEQEVIRKR